MADPDPEADAANDSKPGAAEGSVVGRLRARFGPTVGPGPQLEAEPSSDPGPRSELLERLRAERSRDARYRLLGEVARGGMGAILKVWDEELRRTLAMKVILGREERADGEHPTGAPADVDPRTLGRFLEEAQITGQLDHPGIVPVHELGLDSAGRVYFTMRLVKGDDLRTVFEHVKTGQGGWNQVRALGVLLRVCEAVAYAHAKRVVHRDLKPANVMVGKFGEVYVMDWGLARVLDREDKHDLRLRPVDASSRSVVETERRGSRAAAPDSPLLTLDGDVVGTPSYMAPEQARGELDRLGPHTDVYAIGAMLYQVLAGRMPFVPDDAPVSPYAVWMRVREGAPRPLGELAPDAPAELVAICEKAMAREIADRYADTLALADDLRAFVEGRVVRAYEAGAWAEARKWIRRNRPLAAAIAAAVLAVAAGAVSFALKAEEATAARDALALKNRELERARAEAVANAEAESRARSEADRNAELARAVSADLLSLSAQKDLDDLVDSARELWPPHPDTIPGYEQWLAHARELVGGSPADAARGGKKRPSLAEHRAKLAELRSQARPSEPRTTPDASQPPRLAYDDPESAWWDRQLSKLVADLEALSDPASGLMGDALAEPFGWGVARRLAFARTIAERSVTGEDARRRWEEASALIQASPRYGELALAPQIGLLPIGADPESGLWEFAHLATGEPAARRADGTLAIEEATGLVLVLIPGGTFWMGAQASDPQGRNFDPLAAGDEGPVHEVTLSPYFLSKYEMTQAQWTRLAARNPSVYQPPNDFVPTRLHPVEQVSWLDCADVLARVGLALPSEAQWEHGARGGTSTPWWTGAERESLRGKANLADQTAKRAGATWGDINDWPDLEDGGVVHAEVGRYPPNGFGLHEVAGNLWELCLDGYDAGYYSRGAALDPISPAEASSSRVTRGGSFDYAAAFARSAGRDSNTPELRSYGLGVRPARRVDP